MGLNRRLVFILAPLVVALALGAQRKQSKRPQVEILHLAAARHTDGTVSIEGRLKYSGEKPVDDLLLVFNLLAPGDEIVSSERGAVDEELEPGDETEFHWETRDNPRAVRLKVGAQYRSGTEVEVVKPGPYTIY
jgi:hypothetical protein